MIFSLLLFPACIGHLRSQTVYAVVLGNQKYVVGSSTLHSGLFRSTDAGASWTHLGPENLKAYSMDAVDGSRGQVLYIAAGNGVHRSTDGGASWKILTDWRMTEVLDVMVDQSDPHWIYAATATGFWRSSDGGDHWESPPGILHDSYCYRLMKGEKPGSVIVATDGSLVLSTDHGTNFRSSRIAEAPRMLARIGSWDAIAEDDGPTLLPAPVPIDVDNAQAVMERFGAPRRDPAVRSMIDTFRAGHPTMHTYALAAEDSTTLVVGGDRGAWQFDMEAGRWEKISSTLPDTVVHALAWLPTTKTLMAGTFGSGVFRYADGAWKPSGLEGSQIWSLVVKE
jgi:hypothetical protein